MNAPDLIYCGDGVAHLANVPPSNLPAAEIAAQGWDAAALCASGLYKPAPGKEPPAAPAVKEDTAHARK